MANRTASDLMGSSGVGMGNLDNFLQLLSLVNQQNQPRPVETANVGGQNLLVNRPTSPANTALSALAGAGNTFLAGKQLMGRQQFLKGVQSITASPKSPDEKINDLQSLVAQHGGDYNFGVQDIVDTYNKQANRGTLSRFASEAPEGMEIVGYDQKGQPMFRKVSRNVAAEKFDADQRTKEEKSQKQTEMVLDSARATLSTISEIKKGLRYFGAAGELPAWPAEYSKKNWTANVNRLKDKMVVDLMLNLKSASASGSTGFGPLSEKEGQRLENAATALQKGLKEEDAARYLTEIENAAKKILGGNKGGQPAQTGELPSLKSKYGLR